MCVIFQDSSGHQRPLVGSERGQELCSPFCVVPAPGPGAGRQASSPDPWASLFSLGGTSHVAP